MSEIRDQISYFEYLHDDIVRKMTHKKYYFYPTINYVNNIFNPSKIKKANKIYWDEILLRANFASITSILRNVKWLKGLKISIETRNYILFTASLRGFLESVTDCYYSLLNTPFDIASNFKNIELAINEEMDRLLLSDRLEETLIHFQFASKSDSSGFSYNKPLYATKYIEFFDEHGDIDTKALYSKLCEVVHPATDSISCFVEKVVESKEFEYATTNIDLDSINIELMMNEYRDVINQLLRMSISAPIVCLRVLNLFEYELVESKFLEDCLINNIIDDNKWNEILVLVRESYKN